MVPQRPARVSPNSVGPVRYDFPQKSKGRNIMAESHFFALVSRMRHIERWQLMRSTTHDNLAEHSLDVAMIAHALATIGNVRYGRSLDADRAALWGIFHDAPEIITGDLATPVKYYSDRITDAYREVEAAAVESLLSTLPDDLRPSYEAILAPSEDGDDAEYLHRLVKAADKVSALVKCIEEGSAGNAEFASAAASIRAGLDEMAADLPELADFMAEFLPSDGSTLDELLG